MWEEEDVSRRFDGLLGNWTSPIRSKRISRRGGTAQSAPAPAPAPAPTGHTTHACHSLEAQELTNHPDTPSPRTTTASPSSRPRNSTSSFPSRDLFCPIHKLTHPSGGLAAGFGGVAGFFALFFFAEVPKVRDDIMKKIPILDKFFTHEIPPEDNPF